MSAIWQRQRSGKGREISAALEADVHLNIIGCRIMTLIATLSTDCRLLMHIVSSAP